MLFKSVSALFKILIASTEIGVHSRPRDTIRGTENLRIVFRTRSIITDGSWNCRAFSVGVANHKDDITCRHSHASTTIIYSTRYSTCTRRGINSGNPKDFVSRSILPDLPNAAVRGISNSYKVNTGCSRTTNGRRTCFYDTSEIRKVFPEIMIFRIVRLLRR